MIIRNEYPRPQLRRKVWFPLNGEWEFCFDDADAGLTAGYCRGDAGFDRKINVPFVYQTEPSGIGLDEVHEILWYKKEFNIDGSEDNYLLCFGGVDYMCDVYVNGIHVLTHEGGYTSFEADITAFVKPGTNLLVLRVYDPQWSDIPRGKQSWTGGRFDCWYTPASGIWKSVWIECFKTDYLSRRTLFTNIDKGTVYGSLSTGHSLADRAEITVSYKGEVINRGSFRLNSGKTDYVLSVKDHSVWEFPLWTPESPNLFDIEYTLYKGEELCDRTTSRFGMRKISIDEQGRICLNNCAYYQRLVLDQGYYGAGRLTAESPEQIRDSITLMKRMGFNGARLHQKIDDPYFYYYADELGLLTWLEMPSPYDFSQREIRALTTQLMDIIDQNCSFTSIITYVPFNESWGVRQICDDRQQQDFVRSIYYLIKSMDPTRLISANDGWENITDSDIITIHEYCRGSEGYPRNYYDKEKLAAISPAGKRIICNGNFYHGQPLIFSEYGGIAFDKDATGGSWGYGDGAKSEDELLERIADLTYNLDKAYFQGFCYTQLTDVQQEVNGLCDENLKPKFDVKKLAKIFGR